MIRYANLNGNSSVMGFETGYDYIVVYFNDYSVYKYTYASAGSFNVEQMKKCAMRGSGLNGYINSNCKYKYEK